MTRAALIVVAAASFAACNQNTINTPIRSFDRPSDVALACATLDPATGTASPLPRARCTPEVAQGVADGGVPIPRLFAPP